MEGGTRPPLSGAMDTPIAASEIAPRLVKVGYAGKLESGTTPALSGAIVTPIAVNGIMFAIAERSGIFNKTLISAGVNHPEPDRISLGFDPGCITGGTITGI